MPLPPSMCSHRWSQTDVHFAILSYPNVVVAAAPLLVPKCHSDLWPTQVFSHCCPPWLNYFLSSPFLSLSTAGCSGELLWPELDMHSWYLQLHILWFFLALQKLLMFLQFIQVESNRDSGPPSYSLKAFKMALNFCSQSWQLMWLGGMAQNISANTSIGTLGNSYFVTWLSYQQNGCGMVNLLMQPTSWKRCSVFSQYFFFF